MTTNELLKLCSRIQFWANMAKDQQAMYNDAKDTHDRANPLYAKVMIGYAEKYIKTYLYCMRRLHVVKKELRNQLNEEAES